MKPPLHLPPASLRPAVVHSRGFVCRTCASRRQLQQLRPLTRTFVHDSKSPALEQPPKRKATIRHFEQTADGKRVEINPAAEDAKIDQELDALASKIDRMATSIGLEPHDDKELSPEEQKEMELWLSDLNSNLLDDVTEILPSVPFVDIPLEPFPKERHLYITRLNNALRPAADGKFTEKTIKRLWQRYSLCSKTLSSSWSSVPQQAWTCLWDAFSTESTTNPDRASHLRHLAIDMQAAGVELEPQQQLVYIEALFMEGLRPKALILWEKHEDLLGKNADTAKQYMEMGVMMLSHTGQTEQAQKLVDRMLESTGMDDPRVLLHIIKAWLFSEHDADVRIRRAWEDYVALRRCLGSAMEMKDYDAVIMLLIDANRPDLALAVFKDMMLGQILPTGERVAPQAPGTIDAEQLLRSPELNDTALPTALLLLPVEHRNKFFFGKWIKKLIGDGEIDGAAQVIELMRAGGLRPDSKHMNGIIGAWIRQGTTNSRAKAEAAAQKMIQARLEFINARKAGSGLEGPLRVVDAGEHRLDFKRPLAFSLHLYPRATPETFGILIEDYRRRSLTEKLESLVEVMKSTDVPPSTFLMNQLLLTGMRNHQAHHTWALYNEYVIGQGVKPDVLTYHCLWQLMKARSDRTLNRTKAGYPSCRTLFAEMMKHKDRLNVDDKRMSELHELIVLSFGLADDQMGTAVALHAMQALVGVDPTPQTVRSVLLQLAKVGMVNEHGYRPRRLNLNSATKGRISEIARMLKGIQERREKALIARGISPETLDEARKAREITAMLAELLGFVVYSRTLGPAGKGDAFDGDRPPTTVMALAAQAAQDMGVPESSPYATS